MTKEAMKLALEALVYFHLYAEGEKEEALAEEAITALREALAEQPAQQEPVAWLIDNGGDAVLIRHYENFPGVFAGSEFNKRPFVYGNTSPPAQRTWVGLTHEEHMEIMTGTMTTSSRMAAVEAKLKEKNT